MAGGDDEDANNGSSRSSSLSPIRSRPTTVRRGSQFAGAAAMFQQKDNDLLNEQRMKEMELERQQRMSKKRSSQFGNAISKLGFDSTVGNASMSHMDTMAGFDSPSPSTTILPKKKIDRQSFNAINHSVPSFVSPGAGARASWAYNGKGSSVSSGINAPPLISPTLTSTPGGGGGNRKNRVSAMGNKMVKQNSVSVLSLDSASEHSPRRSWMGSSNGSVKTRNSISPTNTPSSNGLTASEMNNFEARRKANANNPGHPRKFNSALSPSSVASRRKVKTGGSVGGSSDEDDDLDMDDLDNEGGVSPWLSTPTQNQYKRPTRASMMVVPSTFSPSPGVWNKNSRASISMTNQGRSSLMAAPFSGGGSSHGERRSSTSTNTNTRSSFAFIPNPSMLRKSIQIDSAAFQHDSTEELEKIDDIKIEANLPDIDAIIRSRKLKKEASKPDYTVLDDDDDNVPEHIRKYRAKERARLAALDEQERQAEVKIHAVVYGWWFRRKKWPKLQEEYAERIQIQAELEAKEKYRNVQATKIQTTFRGLGPRKAFQRKLQKIRLKQQQEKRTKEIQAKIERIQSRTDTEIEKMRIEHEKQKMALDRNVKIQVQQEQHRLEEIRSTGKSLIEYLKKENQKVREATMSIEKDKSLAQKQNDVLQQRKKQVDDQVGALNEFISRITAKIKKNEIMDQKCRTRFLPRHREDLRDRDNHCVLESRVKTMYRDCIDKILVSLGERNKDRNLNEIVIVFVAELQKEVKKIKRLPIPESLKPRILGSDYVEEDKDKSTKNIPETIHEEDE